MKRSLILSVLLCLFVFTSAFANAANTNWDELRTVVQSEMEELKFPGVAVAVIVDGKVVFSEAFGLANIADKTPLTPQTRFRIGSLTKMFTAAAILSLANAPDARLALDAPIRDYVPDLPARVGDLTLAQLLSHRSGLADRISGAPASERDLFNEPGQIFSYSSIGYSLAGRVASCATGGPFEALLAERVFAPMQMNETSYLETETDTIGYRLRKGKPVKTKPLVIDSLRPAGLLYSNLEDLSRFAVAFMDGQIDPRVVAELSHPRADIPGATLRYGYGTIIDVEGGQTVIYHMGDEPGGSAILKMVPEKKAAIIVLTNMMGRLPHTMEAALQIAAGINPAEKSDARPVKLSRAEIDELAGDYRNAFGLRIKKKMDTAFLTAPLPLFLRWLVPDREVLKLRDDEYGFVVPDKSEDPIKLFVVRNAEGRIEYLFMSGRAFKREG